MEREGVLSLKHLPPYSPERSAGRPTRPVERLWSLTDEPLANVVFERLADLEAVLAERCVSVTEQQARVRSLTQYHWWPGGIDHTATD